MTVRLKLALTVFATGLVTALLVVATVVYSFQRFENETAYRRGMAFLGRVVSMYDNIFDMHEQNPEEFKRWLRGLVLFEPNTELYLLDNQGTVLAKTGPAVLAPGFRVALGPVRESIERMDTVLRDGRRPGAHGCRRRHRRQAGAACRSRRGARRTPATSTSCCTRSSFPKAAGTFCARASPGR